MATQVLCCEDNAKPAICCCICDFPLPVLCEDHLSTHSSEDEDFQHFHLPLTALQDIPSSESRMKFHPWLNKLHSAYAEVKKNLDELSSFERLLDSSRLEVLQYIEDQFSEAKEKLASLRSTFRSELLTSLRDTSSHALESWTPEENSLSALLWNYDPETPETLKLFHMKVEREFMNLSRVFSYSIETQLPSLAQMCQYSTKESMSLETWDSVSDVDPHCYDSNLSPSFHGSICALSDTKRQLEELTAVHVIAQQDIKKFQLQNSHLQSECASLRDELANLRRCIRHERVTAKTNKTALPFNRPISTSPKACTPAHSFDSSNWAIKEGLLLSSSCYNRTCKVYDVMIFDLKGFGEFLFNKETRCWRCPECKLKTGGLSRIMFYKAKWRVVGQLPNGEKKTYVGQADKDESDTFIHARDLTWERFTITTSRLEC